jgi:hypothetical protein
MKKIRIKIWKKWIKILKDKIKKIKKNAKDKKIAIKRMRIILGIKNQIKLNAKRDEIEKK